MRSQILKVSKKHSTKSERRFLEILKKNHIKFKSKVKIKGREVDFLIGKIAIDIDCHGQDYNKNQMLISEGFIPIHFTNQDIKNNSKFIQKWLEQIFSHQLLAH
jgi:very-short-patch-repair endonuclease